MRVYYWRFPMLLLLLAIFLTACNTQSFAKPTVTLTSTDVFTSTETFTLFQLNKYSEYNEYPNNNVHSYEKKRSGIGRSHWHNLSLQCYQTPFCYNSRDTRKQ